MVKSGNEQVKVLHWQGFRGQIFQTIDQSHRHLRVLCRGNIEMTVEADQDQKEGSDRGQLQ